MCSAKIESFLFFRLSGMYIEPVREYFPSVFILHPVSEIQVALSFIEYRFEFFLCYIEDIPFYLCYILIGFFVLYFEHITQLVDIEKELALIPVHAAYFIEPLGIRTFQCDCNSKVVFRELGCKFNQVGEYVF